MHFSSPVLFCVVGCQCCCKVRHQLGRQVWLLTWRGLQVTGAIASTITSILTFRNISAVTLPRNALVDLSSTTVIWIHWFIVTDLIKLSIFSYEKLWIHGICGYFVSVMFYMFTAWCIALWQFEYFCCEYSTKTVKAGSSSVVCYLVQL